MPGLSPVPRRTVRSSTVRLLAGAVAAVVLVLGPGTGAARAHDVLVGTAPAADATVAAAPVTVTLEFSDAPQPLGTDVLVTGPDGSRVNSGAPALSGTTVRQPLGGNLPAGDYTVDWRVTSADGHPLAGTFGFRVSQGAAPVAGSAAGPVAPAAAVDRLDESSSAPVGIAVGAILAVAAALVARQLRRPA